MSKQAEIYCCYCGWWFKPENAEEGKSWIGECPRCEAPLSDDDFE